MYIRIATKHFQTNTLLLRMTFAVIAANLDLAIESLTIVACVQA